MNYTPKQIQAKLNEKGFGPLKEDGIIGPKTELAVIKFKQSVGLVARPYIGPITLSKLFGASDGDSPPSKIRGNVPWVNEISKHMGLHEVRNKAVLTAWLKSDGRLLGDPSVLPWCGDAVETAIKLTLPKEPFTGRMVNPYLARNWLGFGEGTLPTFGSIAVFSRPGSASSGHVGFLVGYDPVRRRYRVRGGNQSNTVSDTWIGEDRLLGTRKPKRFLGELPSLPKMSSKGEVISLNEA